MEGKNPPANSKKKIPEWFPIIPKSGQKMPALLIGPKKTQIDF
jgi:hypothetical protein